MYISKFQISNYKSYLDSGLLEFNPDMNIIVGQNNAGKTALLEALTLNFNDIPHRSIKTLVNPTLSLKNSKSVIKVFVKIEKAELDLLINTLLTPVVIFGSEIHKPEIVVNIFTEWLATSGYLEFYVSQFSNNIININDTDLSLGLYPPKVQSNSYIKGEVAYQVINIKPTPDDILRLHSQTSTIIKDTLAIKLFNLLKSRIYRFYAERLNIGSCTFGNQDILKPDASNLAEVINGMQGRNIERFHKFNKLVTLIFPHIKWVTIEPEINNALTIKVWNIDTQTEREDLAVPLSSCGTGISQVLAILYVVLNSKEPQTIMIDEPQSFLHPGAAKKLIEIFKDFPQHQYIIATHSPTIISAANPSKIIMLQYEDCETKASIINAREATEQRSLIAEIGVSLAEVFGADNILWVEGPTEERCFPLILKKPLRGTTILSVKNTGDLDGKRAELIFEIYDKLSGGASLFPPAVGFLFDREGKSETKIQDLKRRSKNPVEFLPRRMYENYLLNAEAIVAVINEDDKTREAPLTVEEVEQWLMNKKNEGAYLPKGFKIEEVLDNDWLCQVDGANLLKGLFENFCETRLAFSKTKHSFELTQWLVENQPNQLSELAKLLENILYRE
ncbi:AAA family ATPase [Calothrix membranacea FACHB-236]|nr:AAA family ATPase [Calothrix membranacea FACHB-236]